MSEVCSPLLSHTFGRKSLWLKHAQLQHEVYVEYATVKAACASFFQQWQVTDDN